MEENKANCSEGLDAHGQYTQAYVGILNTYKDQIEISVENKNNLKTKFFNLIKGVMITLIVFFGLSVIISFFVFGLMIVNGYQSVAVITGAVTTMLSTFSTMILSIFKLPQIIADYLFNKEEDKQMNEIIKNIQKYEIKAVTLEKTAKWDSEKETADELNGDLPLGQSPNISGAQPQNAVSPISKEALEPSVEFEEETVVESA